MLKSLEVRNLRTLKHIQITPAEGINVIRGKNGSGKTSLLEAISLLGLSRSFVSHETGELITFGQKNLQVFAEISTNKKTRHRIGFGYSDAGRTIKIDGDNAKTEDMVKTLPVVTISPQSFLLIEGTSNERRKRIDWGLFHMEPQFLADWKRYKRLLVQRNAILKIARKYQELIHWDEEFMFYIKKITTYRNEYMQRLTPIVQRNAKELKFKKTVTIEEKPGWNKTNLLKTQLQDGFLVDTKYGFTQKGAHRYDVRFLVDGHRAKHILSRGEKKLLVSALILAQIELLATSNLRTVVLCDDLASEFDSSATKAIVEKTEQTALQTFITATSTTHFPKKQSWKWFHMKRQDRQSSTVSEYKGTKKTIMDYNNGEVYTTHEQ